MLNLLNGFQKKVIQKRSQEDIHSHYDLGNDFYKNGDQTMTYSCAYFKTPEDTLEQAQVNKVHHILDKLFIKGATLYWILVAAGAR